MQPCCASCRASVHPEITSRSVVVAQRTPRSLSTARVAVTARFGSDSTDRHPFPSEADSDPGVARPRRWVRVAVSAGAGGDRRRPRAPRCSRPRWRGRFSRATSCRPPRRRSRQQLRHHLAQDGRQWPDRETREHGQQAGRRKRERDHRHDRKRAPSDAATFSAGVGVDTVVDLPGAQRPDRQQRALLDGRHMRSLTRSGGKIMPHMRDVRSAGSLRETLQELLRNSPQPGGMPNGRRLTSTRTPDPWERRGAGRGRRRSPGLDWRHRACGTGSSAGSSRC